MSLAGHLRLKFNFLQTDVFDCSTCPVDDYSFLIQSITNPFIVGFSVYTDHVKVVVHWAIELRKKFPQAIFIAGGPHVSLDHHNFIFNYGHIFDYAIAGDGEKPLEKLIDMLLREEDPKLSKISGIGYKFHDTIVCNANDTYLKADEYANPLVEVKRPKTAPAPAYTDKIDGKRRKAIALTSSRGCPMKCTFCAIIAMNPVGPTWRAASSELIISWLKKEYERDPFEHIFFLDANFFVNPIRVVEISTAISEYFKDVTWSSSSTVGFLLRMKDKIPLLKNQGLRFVELGIESGSNTQLKYLGKAADARVNSKAIQLLQKNGLGIAVDFIMFYPEQTRELLKENLLFIRQNHLTQEEDLDLYFNALKLYPGTPVRLKESQRFGVNFDHDALPDPRTLFVDNDIAKIFSYYVDIFYPKYLLLVQSKITSYQFTLSKIERTKPKASQFLRLKIIELRHLPFKVLWYMATQPLNETFETTVPFVEGVPLALNKLDELCIKFQN